MTISTKPISVPLLATGFALLYLSVFILAGFPSSTSSSEIELRRAYLGKVAWEDNLYTHEELPAWKIYLDAWQHKLGIPIDKQKKDVAVKINLIYGQGANLEPLNVGTSFWNLSAVLNKPSIDSGKVVMDAYPINQFFCNRRAVERLISSLTASHRNKFVAIVTSEESTVAGKKLHNYRGVPVKWNPDLSNAFRLSWVTSAKCTWETMKILPITKMGPVISLVGGAWSMPLNPYYGDLQYADKADDIVEKQAAILAGLSKKDLESWFSHSYIAISPGFGDVKGIDIEPVSFYAQKSAWGDLMKNDMEAIYPK